MGEDRTEQKNEQTKRELKEALYHADDELCITHDGERTIHRIVFTNKNCNVRIPVKSSIFNKFKTKFQKWNDNIPMNYYKTGSYTLGLSKLGTLTIHIKSDLEVFPQLFLKSMREDFKLEDFELEAFIHYLDFIQLEISHKINDPNKKLENAKINYAFEGIIKKLEAFVDRSKSHRGTLELEIKGDPETSANLEYLLRDKVNAVLFFYELSKIIEKLTDIQVALFDSMKFISNGLKFLLDDLLEEKLNKTEQKTEQKEEL